MWTSPTSVGPSPSVSWSNTQRPPPASGQSNRRRSVLRSIRMSMSVSTPIPPLPSDAILHRRSPTPGQNNSETARSPLPTRTAAGPSAYTSVYGPKALPLPLPTDSPALQGNRGTRPDAGTPTRSGALGGAGNKLKQALANRRLKKASKSHAQIGDDWEDGSADSHTGSPSSPPSSFNSAIQPIPAQLTLPVAKVTSPGQDRMHSDTEGEGSRNGKVTMNSRLRIESKLHALTAGLRKHHVLVSNPSTSPVRDLRPSPPPKPQGLRIQPSNQNLRAPVIEIDTFDDDDAVDISHSPLTPRSSNSHLSLGSGNRPLTPSMIAAQNVAAASSMVSKPVAALAAKVVGTDGKSNSHTPSSGSARNSFQMPNSPSISAALSYMQNIPPAAEPEEKKRDRRKSAAHGLRTVPEYSVSPGSPTGASLAPPPPRTDNLQNGGLQNGPRVGLRSSPSKGTKRRSASLGDVFRGSFTPAMAIAAVTPTATFSGRSGFLQPMNAAQAMNGRPAHQRAGSSGPSSSHEGLAIISSNPSPLNLAASNVAATYQYINAEDPDQPSAFLSRPPQHANNFIGLAVTPASTAAAVPSGSDSVGGIIAPPLPPKKRQGGRGEVAGYGSESSGIESGFGSKGSVLKNSLKGRLAAWTAAANASQPSVPQQRGKTQPSHPPGSYCAPSPSPSNNSPSSTSASLSLSPNNDHTNYSRARSNSSHVSNYTTPNPKCLTATARGLQPVQTPQQYTPSLPQASYTSAVANTAGSIGTAAGVAGGMALNLGKRGWDRVGNLLGHRSGQSGNWAGLAGYASAGEESTRDSNDGGTMSDTSGGHGSGTRMLGTMARGPIRRGRGAVFGRKLEECVRETRVGARDVLSSDTRKDEPARGSGVWVTALVTRCIEHLMLWGLDEEGLFRITGRSTHVSKIRAEFDNGADYILKEAHPSDLDPHAVSSVFKAYLRELPEPLLTRHLGPLFDSAMLLGTQNASASGMGITSFGGGFNVNFGDAVGFDHPTAEAMLELKVLMGRLPKENYDLLHEICKLLRETSKNSKTTKMPLSNLLLVFCPSLQLSPAFLKIVIGKQDYLFGNGDMGSVTPSYNPSYTNGDESSTTIGNSVIFASPRGLPLPSSARSRDQQGVAASEVSKRNRTASIYLPPGFSFTVEAYSESSNAGLPVHPPSLPSRSTTPVDPLTTAPPTPSSASSASPARLLPTVNSGPPQSPSVRSRLPSATKRQPSLASLFSGNKPPTPVISGPMPVFPPRSETPSEPPTLDVQLPNGSFSVGRTLASYPDESPPRTVPNSDSPQTSDSEHFRLADPVAKENLDVPHPHAKDSIQYSPPPQLPTFGSPRVHSGDDWAASVLMAAGGDE